MQKWQSSGFSLLCILIKLVSSDLLWVPLSLMTTVLKTTHAKASFFIWYSKPEYISWVVGRKMCIPGGEILSPVPHGHTTCTLLQTEGSSVLLDMFMDCTHAQRFSDFKPLNQMAWPLYLAEGIKCVCEATVCGSQETRPHQIVRPTNVIDHNVCGSI